MTDEASENYEAAKRLRDEDLAAITADVTELEALLTAFRTELANESADDQRARDEIGYKIAKAEHTLATLHSDLDQLNTEPVKPEAAIATRSVNRANGLALVIGHVGKRNRSGKPLDPGAEGFGFPSSVTAELRQEVYWNTDLAQLIKADADARGLQCEIFTRNRPKGPGIRQAYRDVKAWGPRATIELHFNSYKNESGVYGTADGTETLYEYEFQKGWAEALNTKIEDLFWKAGLAKSVNRKLAGKNRRSNWGPWDNRGIKRASENGRGKTSMTQLAESDGPTAMIEPFFADNAIDGPIAEENKLALARTIVDTFVEQFKIDAPRPDLPHLNDHGKAPGPIASTAKVVTPPKPETFSDEYYALMLTSARMTEPPANLPDLTQQQWIALRDVTFAHWGYETGYGLGPNGKPADFRRKKSELPREHKNFGGQKYDKDLLRALDKEEFKHLKSMVSGVDYTDWDNKTDKYCKFESYEDFITFYWARFDMKRDQYRDWASHLTSERDFIHHIGPIYAPAKYGNPPDYPDRILQVQRRLTEQGLVPSAVTFSTNPAEDRLAGGEGEVKADEPIKQPTVAMEAAKNIVPRLDQLLALLGTTKTASEAAKASGVLSEAVNTSIDQFMTAEGEFLPAVKTLKDKLETAAVLRSLPDIVLATNPKSHKLFLQLAALLQNKEVENAEINYTILSHWALMTGWGNEGDLGKVHFNFAGIKWRENLRRYASDIDYNGEKFCRFDSLQKFLDAYWLALAPADALSRSSASEILKVLAPDNAAKIQEIAKRIAMASTNKSSRPSTVVDLKEQGGLVDTSVSDRLTNGVPTTGFAIHVKRHRVDKRHGLVRTVGDYECYFNGEKLTDPLLSGQIAEQKGPGKNYHPAKNLRVMEGTYPLGTQAGSKYKTHNYRTAGRPRPGVLLGQEDQYLVHPSNRGKSNVARQAILLHPASGFLSSAGCLNFTRPLANSRSSIDWNDSFGRTVAFIDAMKEHLSDFPSKNGRTIRNAVIVIEGEPGGRTRSLLEAQSRSLGGGPGRFSISDDVLARLRPRELFEVIADAVSGEVLPDIVDREIVERALRIGKFSRRAFDWFSSTRDIDELTSDGGQTLWFPWAFGWERSATEDNSDLRKRAQAELNLVAERLLTLGVDINSPDQFQTPLTMASAYGMSAAVIRLIELGARIDAYDSQGNTALITAAHFGHLETVAALLARGANPTLRSLTEADRPVSRSVDGVPVSETEIYVEEPPAGATALEAAEAQRALFKELLDDGVDAVSIHVEDFNSVIAELEGTVARP